MIFGASSSSATDCHGQNRRSAFSVLVLAMILSACTTLAANATGGGTALPTTTSARIAFDQYEIIVGAAERETVLSGFFLGGTAAELVVLRVDKKNVHSMQMYEFDGAGDRGWVPVLDAILGSGVLFVDVANIGGRDRLITYQRGRFNWFDPDSATERPLVDVPMDYNSRHDRKGSAAQPAGDPPHVDVTRDLNRDGRDDLLVPDYNGFWISIQTSDGSFTEAVKLGPPEPLLDELVGNLNPGGESPDKSLTYRDVGITAATNPWYLRRVHEMDYDQDGRSDLVFWNEDHFDVHLQGENGLFAQVAETFVPDVPFDSDGVYSHAFNFSGQGVASIVFGVGKKSEGTVLHSLRDLNGDGVADLVTLTLAGRGITKQRSVYAVHFGTSTAGGTVFARDPGAVIRPRGKGGAMQPWGYSAQWFEDLDGDGQLESLHREIAVGLGGMARALIGNSVPVNVEIFGMEDGSYADKPTYSSKIRRFAPFAGIGNVFLPPVLIGDVNGDGRSDLLVGQNPNELHVFPGAPGPKLFARQPQKVEVALPSDERNTRLVDLNGDGRQDILVQNTSTDETRRVTLLIAR